MAPQRGRLVTTPALSNHLADGYDDGRPGETASLAEAGRQWTAASDTGYKPTSVLQQVQLSPQNGNSPRDAARVLPGGRGTLSTNNGNASAEAQMPLKMAGDLPL